MNFIRRWAPAGRSRTAEEKEFSSVSGARWMAFIAYLSHSVDPIGSGTTTAKGRVAAEVSLGIWGTSGELEPQFPESHELNDTRETKVEDVCGERIVMVVFEWR